MAAPAGEEYVEDDFVEVSEEEDDEDVADARPNHVEPAAGNEHGPRLPARPAARTRHAPTPASEADRGEVAADPEETRAIREKVQGLRVKLLRLAARLGQPPRNTVVAQVMYRLTLAENVRTNRQGRNLHNGGTEAVIALAQQQEALLGPNSDLDFTCSILLLGKTGVGKSSLINSILESNRANVSAFDPETKSVCEVIGTFKGIKLRFIDTPGLKIPLANQKDNEVVLKQVRKFLKTPPDIVLYVDRLDMQSRDPLMDLPLLQSITEAFGSTIWMNAIVVLTHAEFLLPDGNDGQPLSFETCLAQRSHVVQQAIRQTAQDMRLLNPVTLVENSKECRRNRDNERVLPNGQLWRPQLLLLCIASKILQEASIIVENRSGSRGGSQRFGAPSKPLPLPYLLSSLITARQPRRLPPPVPLPPAPEDEENDELLEEEEEKLRAAQKQQKKEQRSQSQSASPSPEALAGQGWPTPDPPLPPTFDGDNPSYRFRDRAPAMRRGTWAVQPTIEAHGWDHDLGISGVSFEKNLVIRDEVPAGILGQVQLDKDQRNVNIEVEGSFHHNEARVTTTGVDLQTVGPDQLCYIVRSETRFKTHLRNKLAVGGAVCLVDGAPALGLKLDNRFKFSDSCRLVVSGGGIAGGGERASGANAELIYISDETARGRRSKIALGLSAMDWRGDLALGGNFEARTRLKDCLLVGRTQLNSRGAGSITVKISSEKQFVLSALCLVPFVRFLVRRVEEMF